MCKISIIMPVHNAGDYFVECLETLLNQTLRDIEIIIILDKPTDGSDQIAKNIAEQDSRIKIIENEKNLHIGESRNKGLDMAKGEYIGFSDHDDFRKLDMYAKLYDHAINTNADVVFSKTTNFIDGTYHEWELPIVEYKNIRTFVLSDLIGKGNYERELSLFCNIHNVIYKKDLLKKASVKFVDTKISAPEDVLFNIEACIVAENISFLHEPFYYHRIIKCSEGHNYSYASFDKRLHGVIYLEKILNNSDILKTFEPQFYIQIGRQISQALIGILTNRKNLKVFFKNLNKVRKYQFIKNAFKFYYPIKKKRNFLKNYLRLLIAKYISF